MNASITLGDPDFREALKESLEPRINYLCRDEKFPKAIYSDATFIIEVFDVLFWASLTREEGREMKGAVCLCSRDEVNDFQELALPEPFELEAVVQLVCAAPAELLGIELGVNGKLQIWGLVRKPPEFGVFMKIQRPGTVYVFTEFGPDTPSLHAMIHKGRLIIPNDPTPEKFRDIVSIAFKKAEEKWHAGYIQQIISAMCTHKHGGTLVILPPQSEPIAGMDIRFKFADGTEVLAKDIKTLQGAYDSTNTPDAPSDQKELARAIFNYTKSRIRGALDRIGQLTALDGAVIMADDFTVYGFGAKLRAGNSEDFAISIFEPLFGDQISETSLSKIGGTRHQSAAKFVHEYHNAVIFVASQDGGLTMFGWNHDSVHPNRVFAIRGLEHYGAFL